MDKIKTEIDSILQLADTVDKTFNSLRPKERNSNMDPRPGTRERKILYNAIITPLYSDIEQQLQFFTSHVRNLKNRIEKILFLHRKLKEKNEGK